MRGAAATGSLGAATTSTDAVARPQLLLPSLEERALDPDSEREREATTLGRSSNGFSFLESSGRGTSSRLRRWRNSRSETAEISEEDSEAQMANSWHGKLSFLGDTACYEGTDAVLDQASQRNVGAHRDGITRVATRWGIIWRRFKAVCRRPSRVPLLPELAFLARPRNGVGKFVLSTPVQAAITVVILLDVVATLYSFVHGLGSRPEEPGLQSEVLLVFDWSVVAVLGAEVSMRIFFLGAAFTHSLLNLFEVTLVLLATGELLVRGRGGSGDMGQGWAVLRALRPVVRGCSVVLKATRGVARVRQFRAHLQLQVSGLRRRYRKQGFDLDLCYVLAQFITMGRPALGTDAFFNNPEDEVARFFRTVHRDRFVIVNATEQCDYPAEDFLQRVLLLPVRETGVPRLSDLWDACEVVKEFLERDSRNVIAVHSGLGLGRVSMLACAWLLYKGEKDNADEAVNFFERACTEEGSGSLVQAFDCPSQQRFVEYFTICAHELHGVPSPPRRARLRTVKLLGIDPEAAPNLVVKVFAHPGRTSLRPPASAVGDTFPRSGSMSTNKWSSAGTGGLDEVLFMMHEEDMVQQAMDERDAQEFDSFLSGCQRQAGPPLLDTLEPDHVSSFSGEHGVASDLVVWHLHELALAGETCVEVHRLVDQQSGESTQLLMAAWLHTSFLEVSRNTRQSASLRSNRNFHADTARSSIVVSLPIFDMDKGCRAPSLRSYSKTFEMQLYFEVDEQMDYGTLGGRSDLDAGHAQLEGLGQLLKLRPPSIKDISGTFEVRWLTWCMERLWPYIESALEKVMSSTVETVLREKIPPQLGEVRMSKFSLGAAPDLGPVLSSERSGERTGLQLDICMRYRGDTDIVINVGTSSHGVSRLSMSGTLSVLFDPLVDSVPIVGGVHLFFLNPPEVRMEFSGHRMFANLANLALVRSAIEAAFVRAFSDAMVLPHRFSANWMPEALACGDPTGSWSGTLPCAVLRVLVVELRGLPPERLRLPGLSSVTLCGARAARGRGGRGGLGPSRHVVFCVGGGSRRAGPPPADAAASASESEPEEGVLPQGPCGACDLLVYDVKQRFCVEVWERQLGHDRLVCRSEAREVHQLFRNAFEEPLSLPMHSPEGPDVVGATLGAVSPASAGGAEQLGQVRLLTAMFELHADAKKVLEAAGVAARPQQQQQSPRIGSSELVPGTSTAQASGRVPLPEVRSNRVPSARSATRSSSLSLGGDLPGRHVALLVCTVMKGRLPPPGPPAQLTDFHLRASLGPDVSSAPFAPRDEAWKEHVSVPESTAAAVQALFEEGFALGRIASMLQLDEALVAKVNADRQEFNVEVAQHLCLLVDSQGLAQGAVELEVYLRGGVQARGRVPLVQVWQRAESAAGGFDQVRKASSSNLASKRPFTRGARIHARKMVELATEDAAQSSGPVSARYDLDVEFCLFAFAHHRSSFAFGDTED